MVEQYPTRSTHVRSTELERQMREIAERFIKRTMGEAAALRPVVEALKPGDMQALHDVEMFAHRIHGSGAMFGFDALSQCAGLLERQLLTAKAGGPESIQALDLIRGQFVLLEAAARVPARSQGGA